MQSTPAKPARLLRGLVVALASLILLVAGSCAPGQSPPVTGEQAPRAQGAARLLYAELLGDSTVLWAAQPDRPKEKKELTRISHQTGYGIKASLSPDGAVLAYTALASTTRATNEASLWLLNLSNAKQRLLAQGVDLPSTPVWSPDGRKVAYRRSTELADGRTQTSLDVVSLEDNKGARLVADSVSLGLYPFAWAPDGQALYYSRVFQGGTDVVAVESPGAIRLSHRVSDGIARDFQLSPDGKQILYSSSDTTPTGVTYSLSVIGVLDGARTVLKQGASISPGAIWKPDAKSVTLGSEPSDPIGGGAAVDVLIADRTRSRVLAPPTQGFDLPVSWSPDGAYLALTHFAGKPAQPGAKTLVIAAMNDGRRVAVESVGDAQFVGWLGGS